MASDEKAWQFTPASEAEPGVALFYGCIFIQQCGILLIKLEHDRI